MGDTSVSSYRLFIALPVPEIVREVLERVQAQCRASLPASTVRWTRPEHFHFTIRFVGKVETSSLPALTSELEAVCGSVQPFDLRCEGLGTFPARGTPRVLWAGVEADDHRLGQLHQVVTAATQAFTAEKAESNFSGHITLGRSKEIGRRESGILKDLVKRLSRQDFGSWHAQELVLMRSELFPAGPRHSVIKRIPFAGCG